MLSLRSQNAEEEIETSWTGAQHVPDGTSWDLLLAGQNEPSPTCKCHAQGFSFLIYNLQNCIVLLLIHIIH